MKAARTWRWITPRNSCLVSASLEDSFAQRTCRAGKARMSLVCRSPAERCHALAPAPPPRGSLRAFRRRRRGKRILLRWIRRSVRRIRASRVSRPARGRIVVGRTRSRVSLDGRDGGSGRRGSRRPPGAGFASQQQPQRQKHRYMRDFHVYAEQARRVPRPGSWACCPAFRARHGGHSTWSESPAQRSW